MVVAGLRERFWLTLRAHKASDNSEMYTVERQ